MNLLAPLALLFAAAAVGIVLMYLLKLRRRREEFSSTMLWRKAVEDLTANARFQKLRQNPLMYLQILLIVLLALALARPTMWLRQSRGLSRVVLIDTSASMNATDGPGGRTRIEQARDVVRRMIGNMIEGEELMLVTFGGTARVAQPFTDRRALLRQAVDRIEPTDGRSSLREALLLAQGVLETRAEGALTVVSDGGAGYLGNLISEDDRVQFAQVGSGSENVGIVSFDLRESFETEGRLQAFAEVENFGRAARNVTLRCLVNDTPVQVREAVLEAGATRGFVFSSIEGGSLARLRIEIMEEDLLAADNSVAGVIDIRDRTEILLVSSGNFFLERALALQPRARVRRVAPGNYVPSGEFDLTVFDGWAPEALGPGAYLFLDAVPPLKGFEATGRTLERQVVIDWNRLHPVMRFVDLEGLVVAEAPAVAVADWTTPLAEGEAAPLIVAGQSQVLRLVAVLFDIYDGDWPLQVSFPIFIDNAAGWLTGGLEANLAGSYRPGEVVNLATGEPVRIEGPDGRTWQREPDAGGLVYFSETHRVGPYRVVTDEGPRQFQVNLLSRGESDIAPRDTLVSGEQAVQAGAIARENREVWPWVVLAGLLLMAGEWHLYCRRAYT